MQKPVQAASFGVTLNFKKTIMNRLQLSLLANALFSSITGLLLILFPTGAATIFSTTNSTVFLIIGIALLLFAGTVFLEVKRQRPKAVRFIIIQDMAWVAGSLGVVLLRPFSISASGYWIIGIIALIVLAFAVVQYLGMKDIRTEGNLTSQ